MIQKDPVSIFDFPKQGEHLLFADEDTYNLEIKDIVLKRCLFRRVGIKHLKAQSCDFHGCIFEDCYFREGDFTNIDFTGSIFRDCNLSKAKFKACSFRYVRFNNCLINTKEIMSNLPREPNLRSQLLLSLKKNSIEMGLNEEADLFLVEQIKTRKEELNAIFHSEIVTIKKNILF
ncbi:hypothetical protein DRN69_03385 [Candidatus Pacearchaeota archaeon]|nr:MAG: hypothetical protein DRN69_03385 [Candidatus Pacearchaeota archaeon]